MLLEAAKGSTSLLGRGTGLALVLPEESNRFRASLGPKVGQEGRQRDVIASQMFQGRRSTGGLQHYRRQTALQVAAVRGNFPLPGSTNRLAKRSTVVENDGSAVGC